MIAYLQKRICIDIRAMYQMSMSLTEVKVDSPFTEKGMQCYRNSIPDDFKSNRGQDCYSIDRKGYAIYQSLSSLIADSKERLLNGYFLCSLRGLALFNTVYVLTLLFLLFASSDALWV